MVRRTTHACLWDTASLLQLWEVELVIDISATHTAVLHRKDASGKQHCAVYHILNISKYSSYPVKVSGES